MANRSKNLSAAPMTKKRTIPEARKLLKAKNMRPSPTSSSSFTSPSESKKAIDEDTQTSIDMEIQIEMDKYREKIRKAEEETARLNLRAEMEKQKALALGWDLETRTHFTSGPNYVAHPLEAVSSCITEDFDELMGKYANLHVNVRCAMVSLLLLDSQVNGRDPIEALQKAERKYDKAYVLEQLKDFVNFYFGGEYITESPDPEAQTPSDHHESVSDRRLAGEDAYHLSAHVQTASDAGLILSAATESSGDHGAGVDMSEAEAADNNHNDHSEPMELDDGILSLSAGTELHGNNLTSNSQDVPASTLLNGDDPTSNTQQTSTDTSQAEEGSAVGQNTRTSAADPFAGCNMFLYMLKE